MEPPRFLPLQDVETAAITKGAAAAPWPPLPSWTGRFLVHLSPAAAGAVAAAARAQGLRVASSLDSERGALTPEETGDADLLVMPTLGVALLTGLGDAMERLASVAGSGVESIRPEAAFVAPPPSAEPAAEAAADSDAEADWPLARIGALASSRTGRGVPVAVLDTGVDLDHPDLVGRLAAERTTWLVSGVTSADDDEGHGTATAGLVAGTLHPAAGARYGVAPDCTLWIAKVLDRHRNGAEGDILNGLEWATRQRCRIALLALEQDVPYGVAFSSAFEAEAARAVAAGCLPIAPVGNGSRRDIGRVRPVSAPANCPSFLAVSAVDRSMAMFAYSNGAASFPGAGVVAATAPGVAVWSAARGGGIARGEGTSLAAAHAAGLGALWAEADPIADTATLRARLIASAETLPLPAADVGAGLLRAP